MAARVLRAPAAARPARSSSSASPAPGVAAGAGAARAAARRWSGCDARRGRAEAPRASSRRPASPCTRGRRASTLLAGVATRRSRARACRRRRRWSRAARERGHARDRRARARLAAAAATSSIAVTGSNGKTTTVELIGHIHREAGLPVAVAGNVGTALTSLRRRARRRRAVVVCEASSFQLEDTLALRAGGRACCSTCAEDHLDRHGTFEAYRAAKLRGLRAPAAGTRRGRAARARRRRTPAARPRACAFGDGAGRPTSRDARRARCAGAASR